MRIVGTRILLTVALVALFACRPQGVPPQDEAGPGEEAEAPPGEPGAPGEPEAAGIDDTGRIGGAARPILAPQPFNEIVVELAHVPGRAPSESARNHVRGILSEVTGKPVRISTYEIEGGRDSWSPDQIVELSKTRRTRSRAPTASIWIGYLDGEFRPNENALGVALASTVAAIFPEKIGIVGALLHPEGVERAVLLHEIGHILALVNVGYRSAIDREDPDHPNHSRNRESVMYWAVEDISVADVFRGGPPDNFDDADRADLEMLKG